MKLFESLSSACLLATFLVPSIVFASCGAAVCPIHPASALKPGQWDFRTDYTYLGQTTLMEGGSTKDPNDSKMHHTESETHSRILRGIVSYQIDRQWGVSATVPWIWRKHAHIHHHHGKTLHEEWELSGLGDIWIDGRYSFESSFLGNSDLTVEAGIKLATGKVGQKNADGDTAETQIQTGSGSTDYRIGVNSQWRIATYKDLNGYYVDLPLAVYAQHTINGLGTNGWINGNETVLGLQTVWRATKTIEVNGGLSGHSQGQAVVGRTKEKFESTGGSSLRFNLGASLAVAPNARLGVATWLPLLQSVNGEQLGIGNIIQTHLTINL